MTKSTLLKFFHAKNALTGLKDLTFVWSDKGLCAVRFDPPSTLKNDAYLKRYFSPFTLVQANAAQIAAAEAWLQQYAAGEVPKATFEFDLHGSEFQRAVWKALQQISYGKTFSYGEIARRIKRPKASRAVGAACGANPVGLVIPCHRVIGSSGALTGFGGGMPLKARLLSFEGSQAKAS